MNLKRKRKMITVKLEIDELAGCVIKKGRKTMQWENLTREEQVSIINTFGKYYALFYRCFKEKGEKE